MNRDDRSSSSMHTVHTDIVGVVFDLMWKLNQEWVIQFIN